jgi:hypothetical protein
MAALDRELQRKYPHKTALEAAGTGADPVSV